MNKKKALAALLVFTLVFIVVYLTSAFINLSFDPHKWDIDARICVGLFGIAFGGIAAALVATPVE